MVRAHPDIDLNDPQIEDPPLPTLRTPSPLEQGPVQQLRVGSLELTFVRALGTGGEGTAWLYRTTVGRPTYAVVKGVHGDLDSRHVIAEQQLHAFEHVQQLCGDVRGQIGRIDVCGLEQDELHLCDEQRLLVLPYVDGLPLDAVLDNAKGLPPAVADHLSAQVAARAADLHAAGIVHRDLKPANLVLIVPRSGQPILDEQMEMIDYGMASVDGHLPKELSYGGTPAYLSPEQWEEALGGDPVGPSTDVYAVGHIAYFAQTGRHLLEDSHANANVLRAAHSECVEGRYKDAIWAVKGPLRDVLLNVFVPAKDRPTMAQLAKLLADSCRAQGSDPTEPLIRRRMPVPAPVSVSSAEVIGMLKPQVHVVSLEVRSVSPAEMPTRRDPNLQKAG